MADQLYSSSAARCFHSDFALHIYLADTEEKAIARTAVCPCSTILGLNPRPSAQRMAIMDKPYPVDHLDSYRWRTAPAMVIGPKLAAGYGHCASGRCGSGLRSPVPGGTSAVCSGAK